MNRKEELIYGKEKAIDKLRYSNIKMNYMKIKHARTRNSRMFQKTKECCKKRHTEQSS